MSTVIMDSCSYTKLGLTSYLVSRGININNVSTARTAAELADICQALEPHVVFINEDCFIHNEEHSYQMKNTINLHAKTLFLVFMAIANASFGAYLRVKNNLLISSKSIKPEFLDRILEGYLKRNMQCVTDINLPLLTLSRTEYSILKLWMAGQDTMKISEQMKVKPKTVSSHKGNIKRKIKTHNKKVIFHVTRLTDNVTNGIVVNFC
ncbi:transcriptional regulator RcsA [Citrobacter sp. JGM124]|uniref:transcriptional regulator RcsA n=1 Tax=Citrobacter sp. JGM124 TaxID=2799789 RepID=UPI001BA82D01|nr:transcriptional regulator RcsA [Citrobacter sp. JGM124]MBS0846942.1 transcriptional regulator RcsA [Citrobacter sp. JGM124]